MEKKWTSVIRLQKRSMELEQEVSSLKEELESASAGGRRKKEGEGGPSSLALPRPPQKHVLKRHRGAVTCVAAHPVYSQTASGSEDASVKLWDYESGEYEKTLKGHTGVSSLSLSHTHTHTRTSDIVIVIVAPLSFTHTRLVV